MAQGRKMNRAAKLALGAAASLAALWTPAAPAQEAAPAPRQRLEERLISALSDEEITIQTLYAGSELLVFGAVERNRFITERDGELDIAIRIRGPTEPLVVWRKERRFGLWVNGARARFPDAPRYYAVASTRPLSEMLSAAQRMGVQLTDLEPVKLIDARGEPEDPQSFQRAAMRRMERQGVYHVAPEGVSLRGETLFSARFALPPNIVSGEYDVHIVMARNGRYLEASRHLMPVRLSGFEQALARAARERPLLYGIGCVLAAIAMGWTASEIFRRVRR
ncbi:TIGR02186 family protein [Neomegalonema sp.]|uniref:TIGR02186 family protein n=1 Tax=Neomegalonema sp. TaxID=2039713 RepID=UPI0026024E74|nr:TIGR02186 family protein [Neomegalonema sp.]MDD2867949.1 TIGR02186 family protein [Neomegalonema sp.]